MKDYEQTLIEVFCKKCVNYPKCAWLCISNDTCLKMIGYKNFNNRRKE